MSSLEKAKRKPKRRAIRHITDEEYEWVWKLVKEKDLDTDDKRRLVSKILSFKIPLTSKEEVEKLL